MARHRAPGLVCALTDRQQTLWRSSYGFADLATRAPLKPDHLFEIGSIGKSFTCLALLRLSELGQLDLHAPVSDLLPWFEVENDFEAITTHHLMTHTAGLTVGADFAPSARFEAWALRKSPIRYPPGTHFHYSNAAYKLLGFLVEDLAGKPYGKVLQEWIFDPLGMAASDPLTTHASRERMAVGYMPYYDDRPWHSGDALEPAPWFEYGAGDGSPACTAEDMAAYLRMLLNNGQGPGGPIISQRSFERMTAGAIPTGATDYGYGLHTYPMEGRKLIKHNGGTIGYLSTMVGDLDAGFGVILMLNGPDPADKDFIADSAIRLLNAAATCAPPPEMLAPPEDPATNLADYSGHYDAGGDRLSIIQTDTGLEVEWKGSRAPLERHAADQFYSRHRGLDRYLLSFQREDNRVVQVQNGPLTFQREGSRQPETDDDVPETWNAYPGHYRAYNPWFSNFRIFLRDGQLHIAYQIYLSSFEEPLIPDGEGGFRIGSEEPTPERIVFDTLVNGEAQRACVFGGDYYRFFTP